MLDGEMPVDEKTLVSYLGLLPVVVQGRRRPGVCAVERVGDVFLVALQRLGYELARLGREPRESAPRV